MMHEMTHKEPKTYAKLPLTLISPPNSLPNSPPLATSTKSENYALEAGGVRAGESGDGVISHKAADTGSSTEGSTEA